MFVVPGGDEVFLCLIERIFSVKLYMSVFHLLEKLSSADISTKNLLSVFCGFQTGQNQTAVACSAFHQRLMGVFCPDPADLCSVAQVFSAHLQHRHLTSRSHTYEASETTLCCLVPAEQLECVALSCLCDRSGSSQ